MNRPTITATTTNSSTGVALDKYTTPKKAVIQAMTNSRTKSSGSRSKLCSLFSNDKTTGFLFKNYSSTNLNNLLGSDFKFKSPSKLIEAKISMSPWKAEENYRISFSRIFESSPMRASNYKLTRAEMEAQQQAQRVGSKDFPSLANNNSKFNPMPAAYSHPYCVPNMGQIHHPGLPNSGTPSMNSRNMHHEDGSKSNRKRKRKNTMQLKILKAEYLKNKEWSKDLITKISNMTGLTESQIYKWNWDQKKKEEDEAQNPALGTNQGINLESHEAKMGHLQLRLSEKENFDLSSQKFKLVGMSGSKKTSFHLKNRRKSSISAKNSIKGSKMHLSGVDQVKLGKRRPFGQVNDSRVSSNTKVRRNK
jgi:hypothetical protein